VSIEGRLRIDLHPVAGPVNRVHIESTRPLQAVRIFEGRRPQEVLMRLPLLFSVCGVAQATAASRAFRQALALADTGSVDAARGLLVQMETAREHLWRIVIDWPKLLDEPVEAARAAPLQAMMAAVRKALFADAEAFSLRAEPHSDDGALHAQIDRLDEMLAGLVFGCAPVQWLEIDGASGLDAWTWSTDTVAARLLREVSRLGWPGIGATESTFLPDLPEVGLNRRLDAADADRFIAEPVWEGRTCETTPLARQIDCELIRSLRCEYGTGLLTRLTALLVELARIPAVMRESAAQAGPADSSELSAGLPAGIGIGQVEAARGRLVHRVMLDDGRVQRYQILAPTEWNFHPAGVAARGLGRLPDGNGTTLRRQAAMLVNSVDPCVGYDLRVH